MLVDGPVQIAPIAAELDVGLVIPDRTAMWAPEPAQPLFDDGCTGENPAVDRAADHFDAALLEHFFRVAVAERIAQLPGHAW